MSEVRQNLFTKESAFNFASTFVAGFIPSRFTFITPKECALIGSLAAGASSLSNAFAGKDASSLKKTLLSTTAFALTYFTFIRLTPFFNRHFMVQIYPAAILQVLAFNVLGHVAMFVATKTHSTTFWNMSDEQIKTLHAQYEKDPKLSETLSNVEKLLLYWRFDKLELSTDQVEDEPTLEEIAALTESQVRTFHEYEAYLSRETENSALFLRYFDVNLVPIDDSEDEIAILSLPQLQTVDDVAKIQTEQLKWYAIYFERNDDKAEALPNDVKKALLEKNVLKTIWNMSDEQIKVLHAKYESNLDQYNALSNAEQLLLYSRFEKLDLDSSHVLEEPTQKEIETLTNDQIRALHQHKVLSSDYNEVLLLRYFNLNLKPFKAIFHNDLSQLPLPKLQTVDDVAKIQTQQLMWYLIYFKQNTNELDFIPKNVHWAFFLREGRCIGITNTLIASASVEQIRACAQHATENLDWWVSIDPETQETLSLRMTAESLIPPTLHPKAVEDVHALDEKLVRAYHQLFVGDYFAIPAAPPALLFRMYELKLPFPNGDTIESLEDEGEDLPMIHLQLPSTVDEVAKLDKNQLPWVYARCKYDRGTEDLSLKVQIALNERFWDTLNRHLSFSIPDLSVENIQDASTTTLKILEADLTEQLQQWLEAPTEVFEAFKVKLNEREVSLLAAFQEAMENLDKYWDLSVFQTYFAEEGKSIWEQLGEPLQQKFTFAI